MLCVVSRLRYQLQNQTMYEVDKVNPFLFPKSKQPMDCAASVRNLIADFQNVFRIKLL